MLCRNEYVDEETCALSQNDSSISEEKWRLVLIKHDHAHGDDIAEI